MSELPYSVFNLDHVERPTDNIVTMISAQTPGSILEQTIPFRFLAAKDRDWLLEHLETETYKVGEFIFRQGDLNNTGVYILRKGTIRTFGDSGKELLITPGRMFGVRGILFGTPREFNYQATEDVEALAIPKDTFTALMERSAPFSRALGNILRDEQGIFYAFERFTAELNLGISRGSINMDRLIPLYMQLHPAIHAGVHSRRIDIAALDYVIKRLPENITSTQDFLLTDNVPTEFPNPDKIFPIVETASRRRNVWQMLPGKDMVLLRDGVSDAADFITCLCCLAVEARKIRHHFHNPLSVSHLSDYMKKAGDPVEDEALLESAGLNKQEARGILSIWPGKAAEKISQIIRNRESFHIKIRRQIHNYGSRRTELWTQQIVQAIHNLLGRDPSDIPGETGIHIISSNTHSVINCLNPVFREESSRILEWGRTNRQEISDYPWEIEEDLIYALGRDYFKEHHGRFPDPLKGVLSLKETVSTGIQVQLVQLSELAWGAMDSFLPKKKNGSQDILINIDYAFGEQAEDIITNLALIFGSNLKSVNVLGKAGALTGKRGDFLLPTGFLRQSNDSYEALEQQLSEAELKPWQGNRKIHVGPLLTVAGTLLQNEMMLRFYRHIWGCTGLEMEGSYYLRTLHEMISLSEIPKDLSFRFCYYVSDVPLEKKSRLSAPMALNEGIPPLYGITRAILKAIIS